jgi:hypothetical protein
MKRYLVAASFARAAAILAADRIHMEMAAGILADDVAKARHGQPKDVDSSGFWSTLIGPFYAEPELPPDDKDCGCCCDHGCL